MNDVTVTTLADVEREVWRLTGWRETPWAAELLEVVKAYGDARERAALPGPLNPGWASHPVMTVVPGPTNGVLVGEPSPRLPGELADAMDRGSAELLVALGGRVVPDGPGMVRRDDGKDERGGEMVPAPGEGGPGAAVRPAGGVGGGVGAGRDGDGAGSAGNHGVSDRVGADVDGVVNAVTPGNAAEVRTCTACGKAQPLVEFWRSKQHKDGRLPQCRTCKTKQRNGAKPVGGGARVPRLYV